MNDAEIREAVNYFNGDLRADDVTEIHQKPLVALATRYLELGGVVEEATIHNYGLGSTGNFGRKHYNHGRQDTLLAMVKRSDGIEEKFNAFIKKWCGSNAPHLLDTDENDGEYFRELLRNHILNTKESK